MFLKVSSMAVVVLILDLIFSAITLLSNLVSRLLFTVTAYLLVLAIQALRVPGAALQAAMEQIGHLIRACVESLLELVVEGITSIVGSVFELAKEGVFGLVVATAAVAGGLSEKMRSAFYVLLEEIPAVAERVVEMVTTMVTDLWNNYMDAQKVVIENA